MITISSEYNANNDLTFIEYDESYKECKNMGNSINEFASCKSYYLLNELNLGITLIETRGGYTNKKDQLIMCVVPTGDYFELKSGVTQIDPKAVILVTDAYQTSGIYTGNTSII